MQLGFAEILLNTGLVLLLMRANGSGRRLISCFEADRIRRRILLPATIRGSSLAAARRPTNKEEALVL